MSTTLNFTVESLDLHGLDYVVVNLFQEGQPNRSVVIHADGNVDLTDGGGPLGTVDLFETEE